MASDSRESSHATSPLLGLACMGHSCLQRAGSGWACRVSERLLPNANVGGGVAESGGWCPPHIRRAHAARAPLCPPTARSMSTQLLCAGPGCERARLMRAEAGAGWRGPGHMGVRAVGAPVLSRREGPLGVGVRLLSACELAARSGTRGGEGEFRVGAERLPAPAHSANSVAERPSRWAWLSRGVFGPVQNVSAEPYFSSTSFPPTKFTFPRHALGRRAECVRLALDTGGRVSLRVWSLQKVSTDPYFYSTSFPPLISLHSRRRAGDG